MTVKIAYLGPVGTYSETAALAFANSLPSLFTFCAGLPSRGLPCSLL